MSIPTLTLPNLHEAVLKAVAIRAIVRMEPAGGPSEKVFPSTYIGGVHCFEKRRIHDAAAPGGTRIADCVLLDSTASQANRLEAAIQAAVDAKEIELPQLVVNFAEADKSLERPVRRITAEQAPHRCYDAILRDSELSGKSFRDSAIGKAITNASVRDASALLEHCPTALTFGAWDSSGPRGGLGEKFARVLTCELVGVDAEVGKKTASRLEPLGISAKVSLALSEKGWDFAKEGTKGAKKPSEVNHGNVAPSWIDDKTKMPREQGVTLSHAEQTVVISMAGLRKIGFGDSAPAKAAAARTLLAALGLVGYAKASEQGWDLRSRCCLVPTGPVVWEVLSPSGEKTAYAITAETGVKVYQEAVAAARLAGIAWNATPTTLTPSAKLVELVRKSQAIAIKEIAEAGE